MEDEDYVSKLLLDPEFQHVLERWSETEPKKRQQLLAEFGLTTKDVEEMYVIWAGTRFRKQTVPADEIAAELAQTIWKIEERESQHAAKGVTKSKVVTFFYRAAAVLILPLLVYTAYLQLNTPAINFQEEELQLVSVQSQPGTLTTVVLPDGSKVWLNSGSSISYPTHFSGKYRDVSITGEAYFEVVKNKDFPMVVSTNNFNVKVYGTKFNLNAYDGRDISQITLVEGSIAITGKEPGNDQDDELLMKPGQTASIFKDEKKVIMEEKDPYLYTAWRDGLLLFRNEAFGQVIDQLSLKYNINIRVKDSSLMSIPLDATFSGENLNEILRLMSLSIPFDFYYEKNKIRSDGSFDKSTIYIVRK